MIPTSENFGRESDDRWAIFDLVARFDDAVNRRDADEFGALWTEDAIWEVEAPRPMRAVGRVTIVETWRRMVAATSWLFRGSFAGVLRIDGERATGRWPCIETGVFAATASAEAQGYDNRSLYEDIYVRHDGRWRVQHRRYLYLWLSSGNLPGEAVPLGEEIAEDLPRRGSSAGDPAAK